MPKAAIKPKTQYIVPKSIREVSEFVNNFATQPTTNIIPKKAIYPNKSSPEEVPPYTSPIDGVACTTLGIANIGKARIYLTIRIPPNQR